MQKIAKTYKIKTKKNWKDKAKELTSYFGKNCFWLFYRHHPYKIERAYEEMLQEGDREFAHFLQRLLNP